MLEPLFQVKVQCIQCGREFLTSRVRPSYKRPYKRDTDFCLHYRVANPEYYVVRVCIHCGFAATENFNTRMTDAQKETYQQHIGQFWDVRDYGGERSWEEALETYKLALLCAQNKNESSRVIAGILHHLAWMYRYQGNEAMEQRFMQFAFDAYISVYETELAEFDAAKLMYLLGEISRRLKNYEEAVKWFARVVNDKKIMDSNMIRACREQWGVVREEMREINPNEGETIAGSS